MATSAGTSAGTPLSANGSQCGMLPAGNSAGRRDGGGCPMGLMALPEDISPGQGSNSDSLDVNIVSVYC